MFFSIYLIADGLHGLNFVLLVIEIDVIPLG